jgi:hypothetical protein
MNVLGLLIYLLCIGLIAWLATWIVDQIPVPMPLNRFIKIAIMVVAMILVVSVLLSLVGVSVVPLPGLR